jgi:hypothetical protein
MTSNKCYKKIIYLAILANLITSTNGWLVYHTTPPRHVTVSVHKVKGVLPEVDTPGTVFKSPLTSSYDMFTGPDNDEVFYTCGTKDGITFKGKVAITNQLLPENVLDSFLIHGEKPDKANIYDMTEFAMQSICAEMTAREFLVDKFTTIDDLLYDLLVKAQVKSKSGLVIIEGKVKVFKPQPTNSDIADIIKKEAEHRQSIRTADEKQKLNKKMASLKSEELAAENQRERDRNKAEQQRMSDSQEAELGRKKRLIEATKEREAIQHEIDIAKEEKNAKVKEIASESEKNVALKLAETNEKLLKEPYLRKLEIEAIQGIEKTVFYGEDLKNVFRLHNPSNN